MEDALLHPSPAQPVCRHPVARADGGWLRTHDDLAEEVPVALEYNGIAHAVMLASPCDLEEFALGFSLSEGILADAQELYDIDVQHGAQGITVRMTVGSAAFMALKARRRSLAGRTGCGLCGTERLDQVIRPLPQLEAARPLRASAVRRALATLDAYQPLAKLTGATHAAAWCAPDGQLLAVFEDVGRHNALDKLIGGATRSKLSLRDGFALVTSRASVEMVQKAVAARMPALVAVSAPTALAVRTAAQCGLTLVAFARGDRFVGYANAINIELD